MFIRVENHKSYVFFAVLYAKQTQFSFPGRPSPSLRDEAATRWIEKTKPIFSGQDEHILFTEKEL